MTAEGNGNGTSNEKLVGFTVKELLADLNRKLDVIDTKLDRKADSKDLDALVVRATAMELRTTSIESAMTRIIANASALEDLAKRVVAIETARTAEAGYGNALIAEFRELQKAQITNALLINSLTTSKTDKNMFNLIWIPVIGSWIGLFALAIVNFIQHH